MFSLSARALTCLRSDQPLFAPVDLQLQSGQLVLLEGDNGIGKTTLLRALLGLFQLKYQSLQLESAGFLLSDAAAQTHLRQHSRWLGHAPAMKSALSVAENWQFLAALYDQKLTRADAEALADQLQLAGFEDASIASLSAGQRKRAQLAPLLIGKCDLWLLDEPFANLDRAGIAVVDQLMQGALRQGRAILASSHGVLPFASQTRVVRLLPELV